MINDTVGALMSCAHEDKNCQIGLILGKTRSVCNLTYREREVQNSKTDYQLVLPSLVSSL